MAGRGGYQPPARPAPVSGPGPLSQRTDGGPGQPKRDLPNPAYGEGQDFQEIQSGAKMESAPGPAGAGPMPQMPPVTGLGEPTQRPGEPVTHGSPSGPGAGPEAAGISTDFRQQNELDASQIAQYLPSLQAAANRPGVPPSFVRFVKYLREFQG